MIDPWALGPGNTCPGFWEVIAQAQQDTDRLRELLRPLTETQHRAFAWILDNAAVELTDDCFLESLPEYMWGQGQLEIGYWLAVQGKEKYVAALVHPSELPAEPPSNVGGHFAILAEELYQAKFGQPVPIDG